MRELSEVEVEAKNLKSDYWVMIDMDVVDADVRFHDVVIVVVVVAGVSAVVPVAVVVAAESKVRYLNNLILLMHYCHVLAVAVAY